jgi:dihydropteridine reductase
MDLKQNPAAEVNIELSADKDWRVNTSHAEEKLLELTRLRATKTHPRPLHAVLHCAGSWMGGGADSLLTSLDPMLDINLRSAVSAAYLSAKFLDDSGAGLLLLTGAAAAANQAPTPGMLAYGMSKAATHQLATSLASKEAGIKGATVACLLPSVATHFVRDCCDCTGRRRE